MVVTSAQVRMARAALNWTVRDLAEASKLHRNTITNIETGKYAGDPATLAAIAFPANIISTGCCAVAVAFTGDLFTLSLISRFQMSIRIDTGTQGTERHCQISSDLRRMQSIAAPACGRHRTDVEPNLRRRYAGRLGYID